MMPGLVGLEAIEEVAPSSYDHGVFSSGPDYYDSVQTPYPTGQGRRRHHQWSATARAWMMNMTRRTNDWID